MLSLHQAHAVIRSVPPLAPVCLPLDQALGCIAAETVQARCDCPSADSSLKDGFAVLSADIAEASTGHPVTLRMGGVLTAGMDCGSLRVVPGTAIRIMTGAAIPPGATAVVASEFTICDGNQVTIRADAREGRNILRRGKDLALNQSVLAAGERLGPAHLGLLAAAGIHELLCYRRPRVAVVATGSELVWPGEAILPGKVAASNMVTAAGALHALGIEAETFLLRDNLAQLQERFAALSAQVDMLITCGGVLDGDKDLTLGALEGIGMETMFHRVRLGPGKGVCLGRRQGTLICCLPGGPPSNHVALVLLALPAVRRLMGYGEPFPAKRPVVVMEDLDGGLGWTQLVYGQTRWAAGVPQVAPLQSLGRLEAIARADCLVELPEELEHIPKGELAEAWML